MLEVLIVTGWCWAFEGMLLAISKWIKVQFILDQGVIKELDLVSITESPVPIVDNMATVHNLSEDISEVVPWHISRLEFIDVFMKND